MDSKNEIIFEGIFKVSDSLDFQERKLDIEITRFLQDTENQWFEMERRMRYSPMALEQELIKHKAVSM
jgi:hypothetical protein